MLIASTIIGQKFITGIKGLTFVPQAQLVYQRLIFNAFSDADNLKVDIGEPHQWLMRIGGHLTKTIVNTKKDRTLSFYGKVNLLQTFGDDHSIQISDTFSLDPTGFAIEGGLGINAQLSHNFSLHGDVNYRKNLQKNRYIRNKLFRKNTLSVLKQSLKVDVFILFVFTKRLYNTVLPFCI